MAASASHSKSALNAKSSSWQLPCYLKSTSVLPVVSANKWSAKWLSLERHTNRHQGQADNVTEEANQERLIEMQAGWLDGFLMGVVEDPETFPWKVAYEDECPIYASNPPKKGRAPKGTILYTNRPYCSTKWSMLAVVSLEGPVKVDVIEGSATDEECVNFFLEAQHYPEYPELGGEAVCDLLEEGWVLLFDRLGRSGRKKYPTAQHFNREVKGAFHDNGIGLGHLPPKGSELDPEEHYNH